MIVGISRKCVLKSTVNNHPLVTSLHHLIPDIHKSVTIIALNKLLTSMKEGGR